MARLTWVPLTLAAILAAALILAVVAAILAAMMAAVIPATIPAIPEATLTQAEATAAKVRQTAIPDVVAAKTKEATDNDIQ